VSLFVTYIIELLNENAGQFEILLKGAKMSQYCFSGWNYTTHFFKFNNRFLTAGKRINGSPTLVMLVEVLKTKCRQESTSIFFHIGCKLFEFFFMGARDACMSHENIIHIVHIN
jgi:hypothetical protein